MGNAAGGLEGGAAPREPRDHRPQPGAAPAAAAPPPPRQPMPGNAELEERFGRVLVSGDGTGQDRGVPHNGGTGWGSLRYQHPSRCQRR